MGSFLTERRGALGLLAILAGVGCGSRENGSGVDDSLRARCVDAINARRATLGREPLGRWATGESCADDAAHADANSGQAHGAFGLCAEKAQNECPGWPPSEDLVEDCIEMMWAEGPGEDFAAHGHYLNLASPSFVEAACGFASEGDSTWVVINFR